MLGPGRVARQHASVHPRHADQNEKQGDRECADGGPGPMGIGGYAEEKDAPPKQNFTEIVGMTAD